jgi:hypothetical protein
VVVDHIGLAAELKSALKHYSNADLKQTGIDQGDAVHALLTQIDIMRSMFDGVDYMAAVRGTPQDRIRMLPVAIEHVLTLEVDGKPPEYRSDSKKRFMKAVAGLVKTFRIASGTLEAEEVKDEVGFFAAVQVACFTAECWYLSCTACFWFYHRLRGFRMLPWRSCCLHHLVGFFVFQTPLAKKLTLPSRLPKNAPKYLS